MATKKKTAKALGRVHIDPATVPLIPGNAVVFWAEERPGRVVAKITSGNGSYAVAASNARGDARVTKILEKYGDITVEFFEDGEKYAEGTFTV